MPSHPNIISFQNKILRSSGLAIILLSAASTALASTVAAVASNSWWVAVVIMFMVALAFGITKKTYWPISIAIVAAIFLYFYVSNDFQKLLSTTAPISSALPGVPAAPQTKSTSSVSGINSEIPPTTSSDQRIQLLLKLTELRKVGALTEQEFQAEKQTILTGK